MDEGTYLQRVRRVFDMMDVRTAFTSDEELARAVQVRSGAAGASEGRQWRGARARAPRTPLTRAPPPDGQGA